jgi:hypothetical protein
VRRLAVPIAAVLLLASCASSTNAKSPVPQPDIRIVQLSGVPLAARHVKGSVSVQYGVSIRNNAQQPITLKQITALSLGEGAYTLPSTSRPFDVTIAPAQLRDVQFFAPAVANDTISGTNGPVTLRLTLQFDSPLGAFQTIAVKQVQAE